MPSRFWRNRPCLPLSMSDSDFSGRLPGPGDRAAAAAVVEQRVDGLLQHPLLVVDDDLGRAEVEQPLEPVVAVDDAAVQVVQVGGREAATVELHHRAQVRRDDRDAVEHHAHRACCVVVRNAETTLSRLSARVFFWPLPVRDDLAQQLGLGVEVEGLEALLDRRGAHAALEVQAEAVAHLAVEHLVALEVLDLEVLEAVPDLLEAVDLARRRACGICVHLALGGLARPCGVTSALAPSASSSARSVSSFLARASMSASRRFSISFFSTSICASSEGRSR